MATFDLTSIAEEAYRAYGMITDFKNYRGEPMPAWAELGDTIQSAWLAATGVAVDAGRAHTLHLFSEKLTDRVVGS